MSAVTTDIVNGICVPLGVFGSYVAQKIIWSMVVLSVYVVPISLMAFCYSRIVYGIRHKVTSLQ